MRMAGSGWWTDGSHGIWVFGRSRVPSRSEEEGVQVGQGWCVCVCKVVCLQPGEKTMEGEKGLCDSVSTKAGEAVVKHSLPSVHSSSALYSLLASLLSKVKSVWLWGYLSLLKLREISSTGCCSLTVTTFSNSPTCLCSTAYHFII